MLQQPRIAGDQDRLHQGGPRENDGDVEDVGTHDVGVRYGSRSCRRGLDAHGKLRKARAEGNYGKAHDCRGDLGQKGDRHSAAHDVMPADCQDDETGAELDERCQHRASRCGNSLEFCVICSGCRGHLADHSERGTVRRIALG